MSNNDLSDIPQLKANSKSAQLTYSSGKYGFTINNTFYEIGGGGMPTLNYTTPLWSPASSSLSYTATKDCYLVGQMSGTNATIKINNVTYYSNNTDYRNYVFLKLSSGDVVTCSFAMSSIHVCEEK